jgi:hypothetical protein
MRCELQAATQEENAFPARQKWNGKSDFDQIISFPIGKDQADF